MAGSRISDAEWQVMDVIWDRHPISASDVVAAVCGPNGWSPRTVKSMLSRLLAKGALVHEEDGKRYLYRPAVTREESVQEASDSFASRVLGGSAAPLLVNLVREARLTPDEIKKLRRVLQDKEVQDREKGR